MSLLCEDLCQAFALEQTLIRQTVDNVHLMMERKEGKIGGPGKPFQKFHKDVSHFTQLERVKRHDTAAFFATGSNPFRDPWKPELVISSLALNDNHLKSAVSSISFLHGSYYRRLCPHNTSLTASGKIEEENL